MARLTKLMHPINKTAKAMLTSTYEMNGSLGSTTPCPTHCHHAGIRVQVNQRLQPK